MMRFLWLLGVACSSANTDSDDDDDVQAHTDTQAHTGTAVDTDVSDTDEGSDTDVPTETGPMPYFYDTGAMLIGDATCADFENSTGYGEPCENLSSASELMWVALALYPQNGAAFAPTTYESDFTALYWRCEGAVLSEATIPDTDMPNDSWWCARTDFGRVAAMQVIYADGGWRGLSLWYFVWE